MKVWQYETGRRLHSVDLRQFTVDSENTDTEKVPSILFSQLFMNICNTCNMCYSPTKIKFYIDLDIWFSTEGLWTPGV